MLSVNLGDYSPNVLSTIDLEKVYTVPCSSTSSDPALLMFMLEAESTMSLLQGVRAGISRNIRRATS